MVYDLRSKDDETAYRPSSVRAVPEHDLLFGFAAQLGGVRSADTGKRSGPPTLAA